MDGMKVTGSRGVGSSGGTAAPKKAAGGFSVSQSPAPTSAAPIQSTGGLSSVGPLEALMALQEVEGPLERRRKAVRRAGRILDVLDEVKLELLDGAVDAGSLHRLTAAVRSEQGEADDPNLLGVLRAIEARAAVELAKLEMSRRAA
jgi:hypothetical protein